jgi:uncharacterized phage protein (TIGR02218 family)
MPKTAPSAGATDRLNDEVQYIAGLIRFALANGTVIGFTDHDAPITFNDGLGSVIYAPDDGASASAIASLFNSSVDELDLTALIRTGGIEYDDLISGQYDGAEVRAYLVNWNDTADGGWKMRRGNVGNIDFNEGKVRFQHLGMLQKMHSSTLVELHSSDCRVKKFGDNGDLHPRCKIDANALEHSAGQEAGTEEVVVKPTSFNDRWFYLSTAGTSGGSEPSWNTTLGGTTADGTCVWTTIRARRLEGLSISTITNHTELILTGYSGDAPDAFIRFGQIIFTSGNNLDVAPRPIADWTLSTLTVKLLFPLNLAAAVSDTVVLVSGCDRTIATCRDTYDNIKNYRGNPYLRGNDSFFTFPDARV